MAINNWTEFRTQFFPEENPDQHWTNLAYGVYGFFLNGGSRCFVVNVGRKWKSQSDLGGRRLESGLDVLARVDEVAIVAAPGYTDTTSYSELLNHCFKLHDRVAILDGPKELTQDALNQLGGGDADESKADAPKAPESEADAPKTTESKADAPKTTESKADAPKAPWVKPSDKSESGETTLYVPWIKVSNPNRVEVREEDLHRHHTAFRPYRRGLGPQRRPTRSAQSAC